MDYKKLSKVADSYEDSANYDWLSKFESPMDVVPTDEWTKFIEDHPSKSASFKEWVSLYPEFRRKDQGNQDYDKMLRKMKRLAAKYGFHLTWWNASVGWGGFIESSKGSTEEQFTKFNDEINKLGYSLYVYTTSGFITPIFLIKESLSPETFVVKKNQ